jgi:hypothetical protein
MVRRRNNVFLGATMAGKVKQPTLAQRYQVKLRGQWIEAQFGIRIMEVFLQYELEDGTTGTAPPSDWRINQTRGEAIQRQNERLGS